MMSASNGIRMVQANSIPPRTPRATTATATARNAACHRPSVTGEAVSAAKSAAVRAASAPANPVSSACGT